MDFKGKQMIITGAGSGIGLALLKECLALGAEILAVSRSIPPTQQIGEAEGLTAEEVQRLHTLRLDVSTKEGVDKLFEAAEKFVPKLDYFVANAGFAWYEFLDTPDWEHIEQIFNTNVLSGIYAAEKLKATKKEAPFQMMITASAMSYLSLPGYALYSGTKAAVRGFADAFRMELGDGQYLQIVYPIATKTNFFNTTPDTPIPKPTQDAKYVAHIMAKALHNKKSHIFPSKLFLFSHKLNCIFPFVMKGYLSHSLNELNNWKGRR